MQPVGYQELVSRFKLEVIPNWHRSFVAESGVHRVRTEAGITEEVFPAKYWPGDSVGAQLEFAIKYDGIHLAILAKLFPLVSAQELAKHIESKPRGKYVRRIWYLYEFLLGERLPLEDLKAGNYVELLEPEQYFTSSRPARISRHRIRDNQLGNRAFCPWIRRTPVLEKSEKENYRDRCGVIVSAYPTELLKRAMGYLYSKETKSSFEIEHIKPSAGRSERFIAMLQSAHEQDFCQKNRLLELQNRIVEPRFAESDYRETQNYVGETVAWQRERIHYVCPKPEDVNSLMDGLLSAHRSMATGGVSPLIHAAVVAYGFVFIHPFEDGNGRIHRFLIHNVLAGRGVVPEGIVFPVSAAMLKERPTYDASLEAFSSSLSALLEYDLHDDGRMSVRGETASWYRYMDMTSQAEALVHFIESTLEKELVEELSFLANYDLAKKSIQEVVDMPDRQIDLFIRICLQNKGKMSGTKQKSLFSFLSEEEISALERIVQESWGSEGQRP